MIPTNIPPEVNRPIQVESVKDLQIKGLIAQLDSSLRVYRGKRINYGKENMIRRALFLDLFRTKNRERLFQFEFMKKFLPSINTFCSRAVEELQIYIEGYSIDEVIAALDLSFYSNVLDKLCGSLEEDSVGGETVGLSSDRYSHLPKCVQGLIEALKFQNFPEPEFTDFTRVPQGVAMRLETGEPNYQFFKQWYDNCVNYVEGK